MSNARRFGKQGFWLAAVAVLALTTTACGGDEAPAADSDAMETAETESTPDPVDQARVFFVAPQDGAKLSADAPVAFEFGIEHFPISPVPETVEIIRENIGHYHLGVDTTCLPVDEIIPDGAPWIHFGDGSNTIDMSLEVGEHMFAVQIGDDEHRTMEGLCETITVMLEEGT